MNILEGKRILVGVTGGIAAYKTAFLVRELVRRGAEVRVVMTPAATRFVGPTTFAALSHSDVVTGMFPASAGGGSTWHITLGAWADAMIIAPATANTIAKIATGFADNALTTLVLALRCPLVVAPAMDADMYRHPAMQENLETLRRRGAIVVPPEEGELASGLTGPGRLPDIETLCAAIEEAVYPGSRDLEGVPVLVTAGPTFERIDPVRFIGNHSSGKMGFAIAADAARRGARVTLVAGPVHLPTPRGVTRVDVTSAAEMFDAVAVRCDAARVIVMSAAVADFRPEQPAAGKIKKESAPEGLTLRLALTTDILAYLGERKRGQVLVGFALETEDGEENARRKLERKHADIIILNNPAVEGAGFGSDTNVVTLYFADGSSEELGLLPKPEIARIILDRVVHLLPQALA
ncbi:MAG: bifunctional phosphopantothenoylcysteine decarboxylase/phosphopantothenate--cysteine ligase CoaBC [Bacteroidota bacterium]|nr:bifunctional phosphopantothenoylcysteine decarboxylase/phosphopantothenate--cysteine ligase CoaBC [Bacteroidota bacterium]